MTIGSSSQQGHQFQKNEQIRALLKATREKRKHQLFRVFQVKVDKSKLSKQALHHSQQLFLQAKWFSNAILASEDIFQQNNSYTYNQLSVDLLSGRSHQKLATLVGKQDIEHEPWCITQNFREKSLDTMSSGSVDCYHQMLP